MDQAAARPAAERTRAVRGLTFLMFFMFAMTTDSVGQIIPAVKDEFRLSNTAASALHYGSMLGIAGAALGLGFLADRIGRKRTILTGLALFALTAFAVPAADHFAELLGLIVLAGVAIGIFKTGALALVGEISASSLELTTTMNLVEGFFAVGAIVGPLLVQQLAGHGVSWRWLYAIAGVLCTLLFAIAAGARYPLTRAAPARLHNLAGTFRLVANPFALGFGIAAFAYVVVECAVYVWMPTLLRSYHGEREWLIGYALPAFFVMRALGRFLGAWLLHLFDWSLALALSGTAIFACFLGSALGGVGTAMFLLPLAGLFMSIVYPTLNSKGIGCFENSEHGAVAGIILFFTCAGAVAGPLAMALAGDALGDIRYAFLGVTGFAALLAAGLIANWVRKPAHAQLGRFAAAAAGP